MTVGLHVTVMNSGPSKEIFSFPHRQGIYPVLSLYRTYDYLYRVAPGHCGVGKAWKPTDDHT